MTNKPCEVALATEIATLQNSLDSLSTTILVSRLVSSRTWTNTFLYISSFNLLWIPTNNLYSNFQGKQISDAVFETGINLLKTRRVLLQLASRLGRLIQSNGRW